MTLEWFERARGFSDWQQERRELRDQCVRLAAANEGLQVTAARQLERIIQLDMQNRRVGLHRIQLLGELAAVQKQVERLEAELRNMREALVMAETALGFDAA